MGRGGGVEKMCLRKTPHHRGCAYAHNVCRTESQQSDPQVGTWRHTNNHRHQVLNILYGQNIACTSQAKPRLENLTWHNPHQISTQSQATTTKHQCHCGGSRQDLSNKQSGTPSTPHLIVYILRCPANPHLEMASIKTSHYLKIET